MSAGGRHDPQHLATISHLGRFWDVYVELEEQRRHDAPIRGRLVFSPADRDEDEAPVATAPIFVEPTPDDVVRRAREFKEHQLLALLRSCLP